MLADDNDIRRLAAAVDRSWEGSTRIGLRQCKHCLALESATTRQLAHKDDCIVLVARGITGGTTRISLKG